MLSKLGIVAGGGGLPARLAAACRSRGRDYFVLGLEGHADRDSLRDCPQAWIRLGEAGRGFEILHEHGVGDVVMAGPVRRPGLWELRPDWRTARFFARVGMKSLGDDGLLRAVIAEFEADGFRVVGVDSILADLLAEDGVWGRHRPDDQALADIARGFEIGQALGRLDVGQSVVVQQGIVLGVEAIEGTDALIARAGGLARPGPGGVLVKLAKPGQERRADLPTIGIRTIEACLMAGLRGIAVEAGSALVVDRPALVELADRNGFFVLGRRLGDG